VTTQSVLIERDGPIATVTLNEPDTRNALSDTVIAGLTGFLETANADETLSCIVVTGAGRSFCSGGNIKDMHEGSHEMFHGAPHAMQDGYRRNIQRIPTLFHALDVPTIAAVNGHAIGAGCDLACMCDIRIANEGALFAESFLRVGLISGDGGAWFLPRVVGVAKALELALTCRTLNAAEAEKWGLVTHVVDPDVLLDEALGMARRIAAFPPKSIRLNKRLVRQSVELSLADSLELAAAYQAIVQHSADQKEAVAALIEKREPHFTGQ